MKITKAYLKQLIKEAMEDESMGAGFNPDPASYMTPEEQNHDWIETIEEIAHGFGFNEDAQDELKKLAQDIRDKKVTDNIQQKVNDILKAANASRYASSVSSTDIR